MLFWSILVKKCLLSLGESKCGINCNTSVAETCCWFWFQKIISYTGMQKISQGPKSLIFLVPLKKM